MQRSVIAIVLFLLLFVMYGWSAIPQKMSFQGMLTDGAGEALNGDQTLTFKLYESEGSTDPLWSETQTISVVKGIFNAILGNVTPLSLPFDATYWLGITVGGAELSPRVQLSSSPYSLNAFTVVDGAITTGKIADEAVTQLKLAPDVVLPPGGEAGGDLTGNYPNPTITENAVNSSKIADGEVGTDDLADGAITQAKIGGGVTLPPSGAAGGDLSGTYPNPGVVKIRGGNVSSNAPNPGEVLQWNGSVWEPSSPPGGPPSGSAGGDLTGTYPNPTIANNAVTLNKIQPNVLSSLEGVINDGGGIDLIEGDNIEITANDAANTITISATGIGDITEVTAGNGLTGGGTTDGVTLHVGSGNGINVLADAVSLNTTYTDGLYVNEGQTNSVSAAMITPTVISGIDGVVNDAGNIDLVEGSNITITPNDAANTITIAASGVGDITEVTAGNGLTGGGTTDGVTLHVGSGNGISVSADAVSLNTTYTDGLYVNEGQVNSVNSGMIQDLEVKTADLGNGSVTVQKISSAGADVDQVIFYDGQTVDWRTLPSGLGGSGSANYVPKFISSTNLGNSQIYDSGSSIGIGTTNPNSDYKLHVVQGSGNMRAVFATTSSTGVGAIQGSNYGTGMGIYSSNNSSTYGTIRGQNTYSAGLATIFEGYGFGQRVFAVTNYGDVLIDGKYTGPADFAEMVAVSSGANSVEPGDVMVIDTNGNRSLIKSSSAHSTLVAGIYSTNPGFIGSERDWDKAMLEKATLDGSTDGNLIEKSGIYSMEELAQEYDEIPVAIMGIVPCKVSAENGAIQPGDLLVTSNTPGHAMRDENPKIGTVLGKALESLSSGTGVMRVLVTLQ